MFRFVQTGSPIVPITNELLDELEQEFQLRFPPLLRKYWMHYNGAKIHESRFRVNGQSYVVSDMLTLCAGNMSADRIKEIFSRTHLIPHSFFPIAMSDSADDYFIDTLSGEIYYHCLDFPTRTRLICHSLEAFFALMNSGLPEDHFQGLPV